MEILRNSKAFRDTQYSVSEDFSKTVGDKRRHLWQYAKAKREDPGNKVYLSFDKLIINGKAFTWDEIRGEVVPARSQ